MNDPPVPDAFAADLDRLYGVSLGDFVAARTTLAKRLRGAGERDAAAAVAKLAKPSQSAWAVNQLLRSGELEGLFAAGDAVRRVQEEGLGAAALRASVEARRQVVRQLVEAAAGHLLDAGFAASDASRFRIARTLEALSVLGPEAAAGGRLSEDLEPPGFDGILALGLQIAAPPPREPASPSGAAETDAPGQDTEGIPDELAAVRLRRAAEREAARQRAAEEAERKARVTAEARRTKAAEVDRLERELRARLEEVAAAQAQAQALADEAASAQRDAEALAARAAEAAQRAKELEGRCEEAASRSEGARGAAEALRSTLDQASADLERLGGPTERR